MTLPQKPSKKAWILAALAPATAVLIAVGLWEYTVSHRAALAPGQAPAQHEASSQPQAPEAVRGASAGKSVAELHRIVPAANSSEHASKTERKSSRLAQAAPAGCYLMSFRHKHPASDSSDDEGSHHRNLIKIDRQDANLASVCIRVNGTPVHHQLVPGTTDEFVIGPVAGPNDVITARFCVGKARCGEACPYPKKEVVKKDEFLEAIGAGDDGVDTASAQWESGDATANKAVDKALDGGIKKALSDDDGSTAHGQASAKSQLVIFAGWIASTGTETGACHQQHEAGRSTASIQQTGQ